MMEMEERYKNLVEKCIEKDKFIRHLGSVLRACRCGIVTSAILDEFCQIESQLEKSDYLQLISPLVHGHTRIRLQDNGVSSDKYTGQIVSVPINTDATSAVSWSHVGDLGALSSQLLTKQDDRQNRSSTENYHSHNVDGAQFVPVSENRTYQNPDNFVSRLNLETDSRYPNEGSLPDSTSQYNNIAQVVSLPETDQFHGRVNIGAISEGFESGHLQNTDDGPHTNTEETAEQYSGHISDTNNQYATESHNDTDQNNRYINRQNTDARNLLTNLTEIAYQNLVGTVDNVQFPAVSPAESNSEMFTLQAPVISMQMSDNRVQHVTAFKSTDLQHSAEAKSKPLSPKAKREIRPIRKQPLDFKGNYQHLKHRCDVCGKGFSKPSKMSEHVRVHTGEKPYKCSQCMKCFAQSGTLKYHMRIHSGEKPFTCSDCGKTFTQPGQLSSHKLIHREKFYKCPLCKKSFPEETLLDRHVKIHKKERPHKCTKCGKCFLHSGNLVIHIQKCMVSEDDLKCKECGEVFTSKDNLDEHDEEHSKDKPHQCDVCLKRFKRPLRLKKHESTHKEVKQEKSHMCEICGQCYGKPSLLKIHMRIHTGEKPFMCDFCGKFLGSANNLRRHVLSHTGERNFKCKDCSKTFSTAHNLEYHSRVHSGLKPFKCETCGKCFPFSFSLDRHMRTHRRANRT